MPSPPVPAQRLPPVAEPALSPEQIAAVKQALTADHPRWTVWYSGAMWYAAGPCPCSAGCTGRRTLYGETPDLLRGELRRAAERLANRATGGPGTPGGGPGIATDRGPAAWDGAGTETPSP